MSKKSQELLQESLLVIPSTPVRSVRADWQGGAQANRAIQANLEWKVLLYSGKFTARSCHEPDLSQMPDFPFYAFFARIFSLHFNNKKTRCFLKQQQQKKAFCFKSVGCRAEQSRRRNYTNLPAQPAGAWPAVNPLNSRLWSPFPAELGPDNRHGNKHKTARKKHPTGSPQCISKLVWEGEVPDHLSALEPKRSLPGTSASRPSSADTSEQRHLPRSGLAAPQDNKTDP